MQELVVGIEKTKDEKLNKIIICGLLYLSTNKVVYFPALKSFLQTQTKKKTTSRSLHKTLPCHQCCLSQLSSRPIELVKTSDFLQTKVISIIKPRAHGTSSYSAVLRPPLPDNLLGVLFLCVERYACGIGNYIFYYQGFCLRWRRNVAHLD